MMNMRHHGLTGSHSSPRSEGARASGRRAQSRGAHEAEKWVRGLEASSAPFDAVEDAEQLGGHREVTDLHHPASWVASHQRAGPDLSQDRHSAISTSAVCRVRSCYGRACCVSHSQGLAKTPTNGYAGGAGTTLCSVQRSTAPTTPNLHARRGLWAWRWCGIHRDG